MSEERILRIFHIIITVHAISDFNKSRSDIRDNVFHLTYIDIPKPAASAS